MTVCPICNLKMVEDSLVLLPGGEQFKNDRLQGFIFNACISYRFTDGWFTTKLSGELQWRSFNGDCGQLNALVSELVSCLALLR